MRVTDELTTLLTFQKSFDLLGCIVNIDRAFLTYYTATLIELVKEPWNRPFEFLTKTLGLPVDMVEYHVDFLIDSKTICLSKLTGKLTLVVGERLSAAPPSNHEADLSSVTRKQIEPPHLILKILHKLWLIKNGA